MGAGGDTGALIVIGVTRLLVMSGDVVANVLLAKDMPGAVNCMALEAGMTMVETPGGPRVAVAAVMVAVAVVALWFLYEPSILGVGGGS